MPQQTNIYMDFTTNANHLGNLVRWEDNDLPMPKDKTRQPKLAKKKKQNQTQLGTIVIKKPYNFSSSARNKKMNLRKIEESIRRRRRKRRKT
jgi:hypothetical protein